MRQTPNLKHVCANAQRNSRRQIARCRQARKNTGDCSTTLRLPAAIGHVGLVERVWDNLITNAIKYSSPPAQIEVGGELWRDGMVRYWVRDHGDGIPPDVQSHLFDPFYRRGGSSLRGHGLGLALVKRIVTQLGGAVSVESSGKPGEGAVFYFTLPRA